MTEETPKANNNSYNSFMLNQKCETHSELCAELVDYITPYINSEVKKQLKQKEIEIEELKSEICLWIGKCNELNKIVEERVTDKEKI